MLSPAETTKSYLCGGTSEFFTMTFDGQVLTTSQANFPATCLLYGRS